MNKHDYSYDYLRAFAAIMIVCCHVCQGFGLSREVGYYLGGTFVDLFLLLSAYLLGLSSREKVADAPRVFLQKRTVRLIPTYYTFLTVSFLIIILFIGIDNLSIPQVAGQYLFLNWFWVGARIDTPPFPQLGHLWFMSCIITGYLLIICISQLIKKFPALDKGYAWKIFGVGIGIVATMATMRFRVLVYPFTVLLGFTILFFRGREIMLRIRNLNHAMLVILLAIGNMGGVFYYISGGYNYPQFYFWINLTNAVLWIATAPIIFNTDRIPRVVLFISSISFEIYLLHHPFCLGCYSLKHYMPIWAAAICVFIIALSGGWLLSQLTAIILKLTHHVFKKNTVA